MRTTSDVYHFPCLSVSATAQVQAVVQALSAANAKFGYYWIDVEQGAGWSTTNFAAYAEFLTQLIQAAQAQGLTVGIYTSPYEWGLVINSNQFAQYPLWYAEYDSQTNFTDFSTLGGWTQPAMKQFAGNLTNNTVSFDANWAPVLPPTSTSSTTQSAPPPPPSSPQASAIRSNVTTYANSIAGTSAVSNYPQYVSIIAPGETITTQQSMATMARFLPGLCVGPTEVLNASQLGTSLSFCHYWQSAGVTVSPAPRGYQLIEGNAVTLGGVSMNAVTAQNDAGNGEGADSGQGPGQAEWLITKPLGKQWRP